MLLACLACLPGAASAADPAPTVRIVLQEGRGPLVGDGDARYLYAFSKDRRAGGGSSAAESRCDQPCTSAWPPYTVDGPVVAGEGIPPGRVGTIERPDGKRQVTYDGWPLYRYHQDGNGSRPQGHRLKQFDGDWFLLRPDGGKADLK